MFQVVSLYLQRPIESLDLSEVEALKHELMQLIKLDASKWDLDFELFSGSSVIRIRIRSRSVLLRALESNKASSKSVSLSLQWVKPALMSNLRPRNSSATFARLSSQQLAEQLAQGQALRQAQQVQQEAKNQVRATGSNRS